MNLKARLCIMMFLEWAVKGVWYPIAGLILTSPTSEGGMGFNQHQKGWIIGLPLAAGAFLSPLAGSICDRWLNTERYMGIVLIIAGVLKYWTAYQTGFWPWLLISIGYGLCYVPTTSLANSLAMANLKNPTAEFPTVRMCGTIGWIAVLWGFPMIWLQENLAFQWLPPFLVGDPRPDVDMRVVDSLKAAGILAVILGVFCLFGLPKTPPRKTTSESFALTRALALLKKPSFATLLGVGILVSVLNGIYFMQDANFLFVNGLPRDDIFWVMSIGQFSEIAVLAVMGRMLSKWGFRWMLFTGIAFFTLRYGLFSIEGLGLRGYIGIHAIHGLCYASFFMAAFVYVDRVAPEDVRHSAQTLFLVVMYGVGPLLAGLLNGYLAAYAGGAGGEMTPSQFSTYWQGATFIGLAAAVIFLIFFRDETREEPAPETT